ncbi:MAG: site-specific integrase [Muribaculaceae bacterium]|nr:site-specific integrase [Muribaculaceae bacterium]
MCSIKLMFQPPSVAGQEGTIFYQIVHDKRRRQIISPCHVLASEWDDSRGAVVAKQGGSRFTRVRFVRDRIRMDMNRLMRISEKLTDSGFDYTVDDVVDEYQRYMREYSLLGFMEDLILKLRHNGKIRTSETYTAARNSFRKFLYSEGFRSHFHYDSDIMMDCISTDVMEAYQAWLKARGNTPNTISFYVRIIRAVYNRAVEGDVIENRHPFRHVYTGVERTVKRALPLQMIRAINGMELKRSPSLDFARDMFIMSFMLRGMSFIDMAFLKKTDLRAGYVSYRRRKTGQLLVIKWTREMQRILDKYPENTTPYLLPIIRKPGTNERYTYRNVGYNINHNLKRIAARVGLTVPLTLYVARHSWASVAKAKGVPISVISEGLGHDSEATTLIYLANLDTSVVDKANSLILRDL